jgi:hypothetical protein
MDVLIRVLSFLGCVSVYRTIFTTRYGETGLLIGTTTNWGLAVS